MTIYISDKEAREVLLYDTFYFFNLILNQTFWLKDTFVKPS